MPALRRWTARLVVVAAGCAASPGPAAAQNAVPVVLAHPRPHGGPARVVVQQSINTSPYRNGPIYANTYTPAANPFAYNQYVTPAAAYYPPAPFAPQVVFNPGFVNPFVFNPAANPIPAANPAFNPGFVNPPFQSYYTSPGLSPVAPVAVAAPGVVLVAPPPAYYDPLTGLVLRAGPPGFLRWMW